MYLTTILLIHRLLPPNAKVCIDVMWSSCWNLTFCENYRLKNAQNWIAMQWVLLRHFRFKSLLVWKVSIVDGREQKIQPWDGLWWHDLHTKLYEVRSIHSNVMQGAGKMTPGVYISLWRKMEPEVIFPLKFPQQLIKMTKERKWDTIPERVVRSLHTALHENVSKLSRLLGSVFRKNTRKWCMRSSLRIFEYNELI
jgi:hypothetical protein